MELIFGITDVSKEAVNSLLEDLRIGRAAHQWGRSLAGISPEGYQTVSCPSSASLTQYEREPRDAYLPAPTPRPASASGSFLPWGFILLPALLQLISLTSKEAIRAALSKSCKNWSNIFYSLSITEYLRYC